MFLALLAEVHLQGGKPGRAIEALETARQMIENTDERNWEAGVHLLLGKTLLRLQPADPAEAENRLSYAIEIAARQEAKLLELRAATSLGELWLDQGKHEKARPLLEGILGRFAEGYDNPDLIEARELLEQLSA